MSEGYKQPSKPEREWTRDDFKEFSAARGAKIIELARDNRKLRERIAELTRALEDAECLCGPEISMEPDANQCGRCNALGIAHPGRIE